MCQLELLVPLKKKESTNHLMGVLTGDFGQLNSDITLYP